MKRIRFYILVLFASLFLTVGSFGQNRLKDSIMTDLKLSDDVVKKLDNKDVVETIKFIEQLLLDREMATRFADPSRTITDFMPVIFFIFLLIALYIPFYFDFKKVKGRQLIINNLIEKGKEIPNELLSPTVKKNVRSDFHKGIILIALGLSLCFVLFVLKITNNYWTIGLIPMFIGIGYLISFRFDKQSNKT